MKARILPLLACLLFLVAGCQKEDDTQQPIILPAPADTTPTLPTDTTQTDTAYLQQGLLPGLFSVSPSVKVHFSQGNLQYSPQGSHTTDDGTARGTWRFAAQQYEVLGDANLAISDSTADFFDLFGWGTSGFGDFLPYLHTSDYTAYPTIDDNIANSPLDWGQYNAIDGGGNRPKLWRTLSSNEWKYLLESRPNAANLRGLATIDGTPGLVLLPDNWTRPDNAAFSPGIFGYSSNTYTPEQWDTLQAAGAVFLPVQGYRGGSLRFDYNPPVGYYWTSSFYKNHWAYQLKITPTKLYPSDYDSYIYGYCVRLVRDQQQDSTAQNRK